MRNDEYFAHPQQQQYPQQSGYPQQPYYPPQGYPAPERQSAIMPQGDTLGGSFMPPLYEGGGYAQQGRPAATPVGGPGISSPYGAGTGAATRDYCNQIDADARLDELNKALDLINGTDAASGLDGSLHALNKKMDSIRKNGGSCINDRQNLTAVLNSMEQLAQIVSAPEDWFPAGSQGQIAKFKPLLGKLAAGLRNYIDKLNALQ